MLNKLKINDIVKSKINKIEGLTYKVVKILKTVCWVTLGNNKENIIIYKNVRYNILEKIK